MLEWTDETIETPNKRIKTRKESFWYISHSCWDCGYYFADFARLDINFYWIGSFGHTNLLCRTDKKICQKKDKPKKPDLSFFFITQKVKINSKANKLNESPKGD